MTYADKTIHCVECSAEFVFSAGEQEFFAQRGLSSEPKRCATCRKAHKQRAKKPARRSNGEYRSPAFRGSAPEHEFGRGPSRGGSRGKPADYRSPSFSGAKTRSEDDYRAPAFIDIDVVEPEDEYRAPGFKEFEAVKPEEEYRAPGFAEYKDRWKDQRPMFSITCAGCGQNAMVPFLPEEKERPLCTDCHKAEREAEREAQRQAAAEEAARKAAEEAARKAAEEAASAPPPEATPDAPSSADTPSSATAE